MAVRQPSQPFTRRGLLAQQQGFKEPPRHEIYRRGRVSNSGASLQVERPVPGEAGKAERERAKFLGDMNQFLFGKNMIVDQYTTAEREKGVASWEKANGEQRKKLSDAIKNGWIEHKESYAYREGVEKAYTNNLLSKASIQLHTNYQKWEGKNNPNSKAFEEWMQGQDSDISINLEGVPDHILAQNFHEQYQAIKRQLAARHSTHLNQQYVEKSYDEVEQRVFNMLYQNDGVLMSDLKNNPSLSLPELLDKQRYTEQDFQKIGRLIKTVKKDGTFDWKVMDELQMLAGTEGGVYDHVYRHLTKDSPIPEGLAEQYAQNKLFEGEHKYFAGTKKISKKEQEALIIASDNIQVPPEEVVSVLKQVVSIPEEVVLPPETIVKLSEDHVDFEQTLAKSIDNIKKEEVVSKTILAGNAWDQTNNIKDKALPTMKDWITEGDTPTKTLISFLRSDQTLENTTINTIQSWVKGSKQLTDDGIKNKYNKYWVSYLKEYYGRGKKVAYPIYDSKKGWYTNKGKGNWQNAKIDVEHFYTYLSKEGGL